MLQPIKMLERRFNLFPAKFFWQGRIYEVEAVNECKTVPGQDADGPAYHFWVRCNGQRLHLCELLSSGKWIVQQD